MLAWFGNFESQKGLLSLTEFRAALQKAEVQAASKPIFDYIKAKQGAASTVDTVQLVQHVEAQVPCDWDSVIKWVIQRAAQQLHEQQTPVRDTCLKFESGAGEILYSDFAYQLLPEELGLKQSLSKNMIDLLQLKYNPKQGQHINYEPFIQDLLSTGQQMHTQVFEVKAETELLTARSARQPDYSVRSKKNTYCSSIPFGTDYLQEGLQRKCCDDIMLQTRQ